MTDGPYLLGIDFGTGGARVGRGLAGRGGRSAVSSNQKTFRSCATCIGWSGWTSLWQGPAHLLRGRTRVRERERIEMSSRIPQDIERQTFDLIVVGAGINGAGVARDAAMRGLRVLLLDKRDISSGTTQWATRLIHGGLRYLEYYEFALVRESLRDREAILHIAQHLVK